MADNAARQRLIRAERRILDGVTIANRHIAERNAQLARLREAYAEAMQMYQDSLRPGIILPGGASAPTALRQPSPVEIARVELQISAMVDARDILARVLKEVRAV